MTTAFDGSRAALLRAIRAVFPDAKPVRAWAGIEAWGAPRPPAVVEGAPKGAYDPRRILIGIAQRKAGPTIYFLDPGDYFALDTHRALLEKAGLKVGRGCIYHTRKAPLPEAALRTLFRRVKARDAKAAKGTKHANAPAPPASVQAYLAALPKPQRMALVRLRAQIRAAAPKAEEKIAYGMPTWVHAGRSLVHMAAFKDHLSFFPGSGATAAALAKDLEGYATAMGTIRFTHDDPLPPPLVKKIVRMRVAENEALAKDATKKRKKTKT